MHPSFLTKLWLCVYLILFTASCSNAEPIDSALIDTWESTGKLDGRNWKFTYAILENNQYRFTSSTTDGSFHANQGQWSLSSRNGFEDGGTYEFSNDETVAITGKLGTGIWKRVGIPMETRNTKIDPRLVGTWETKFPIEGREWTFTWELKITQRYQLTGVTNDGTFSGHDGQWVIVASSGKKEEGTYSFLNNGRDMSMTGPAGTGMWSRAGHESDYQKRIAGLNKNKRKPLAKKQRDPSVPLCTASVEEKGSSGINTEQTGRLLSTMKLTSGKLTDDWQPSSDDPHVRTWQAPRKTLFNLCGHVSLKIQGGHKIRGYVYLPIHNTHQDALNRITQVKREKFDKSFTLEHLQYEELSIFTHELPNGDTFQCVSRKTQRVGTPHRTLCVGMEPIAGVMIQVRGDFEQYDFDEFIAVKRVAALGASVKEVLMEILQ